jgi:tRNA-splicing ligase RtcB
MKYCVEFALANRKLMMDRITDIFNVVFNGITIDDMINIAHNYASLENHFGENVWIHRKGATLAREDTIGIIPGSQGTKSYIVKGKGNVLSFKSCSHGAGRKMGRNDAVKRLNLEEEIKKLDEQGIIHGIRHQNDLDEASGAYKDIDVVMRNQEDLVEILVELQPLAVIKG